MYVITDRRVLMIDTSKPLVESINLEDIVGHMVYLENFDKNKEPIIGSIVFITQEDYAQVVSSKYPLFNQQPTSNVYSKQLVHIAYPERVVNFLPQFPEIENPANSFIKQADKNTSARDTIEEVEPSSVKSKPSDSKDPDPIR